MVENEVLRDLDLVAMDKAIYAILCSFANLANATAWPSISTLMKLTGASKNTVLNSLRKLESKEYIVKIPRINGKEHSSNLYILTGKRQGGSSSSEPGVVHPVNHPSSSSEPGVVHPVNPNYNQLNNNHLTINGHTKKSKKDSGKKPNPDKYEGFYL